MSQSIHRERNPKRARFADWRPGHSGMLLTGMITVATVCGAYALFPRLTGAAKADHPASIAPSRPTKALQGLPLSRAQTLSRLSRQPEANAMRRRLGRRFIAPGLELTTINGILRVGLQSYAVTITRRQDDDTERVSMGLDTAQRPYAWDGGSGASNAGSAAGDADRSLVERVALDSPDQFILAQLRGASYYTVARSVMPQEAGGSDNYAGPVWDVVRIGEPSRFLGGTPGGRMFYINTSTGLIDRIYSQEQGATLVAELSGWVSNWGELDPSHITWKQDGQVIMELTISRTVHGPKQ